MDLEESTPNTKAEFPSYRFPAEWEKQSSLLIVWPHHSGDFGASMADVESTFTAVAKVVSSRQKLLIGCHDDAHQWRIEHLLQSKSCHLHNVVILPLPYDDIWVRDTAPLTVIGARGLNLRKFQFNGWGKKYAYHRDAQLSDDLYNSGKLNISGLISCDIVLEGGAIETDGKGTLLANTHCVLNRNRNTYLTKEFFQQKLSEWMGIKKILWLDSTGLAGDDTDGHIDTLARFCPHDRIIYNACDHRDDPNFEMLSSLKAQLLDINRDNQYRLVPLPIPPQPSNKVCEILPYNYVNFAVINGAVLVPNYQHRADAIAMQRLQQCFPDRTLLGIPSHTIVKQAGSLHCMTMHYPAESKTLE